MKAVIFDFDGTIVDSFETLLSVFYEITDRPEMLTKPEIEELRGMKTGGIIKYLGIKKWQVPGIVIKAKKSVSLKLPGCKTFPGIPEVITKLHKKGYKLYILSSNSSINISAYLKKNNLDTYFVQIYGDIGMRSKSSALNKLIKKEGLNKSDCVYVGDEVRDVEAAKKAGITSIGVTWGFNNKTAIEATAPNHLANKPSDLIRLLK